MLSFAVPSWLWIRLRLGLILGLYEPLGFAVQKFGTVVQVGIIAGITGILRAGFIRKKSNLVVVSTLVDVLPRIDARCHLVLSRWR